MEGDEKLSKMLNNFKPDRKNKFTCVLAASTLASPSLSPNVSVEGIKEPERIAIPNPQTTHFTDEQETIENKNNNLLTHLNWQLISSILIIALLISFLLYEQKLVEITKSNSAATAMMTAQAGVLENRVTLLENTNRELKLQLHNTLLEVNNALKEQSGLSKSQENKITAMRSTVKDFKNDFNRVTLKMSHDEKNINEILSRQETLQKMISDLKEDIRHSGNLNNTASVQLQELKP